MSTSNADSIHDGAPPLDADHCAALTWTRIVEGGDEAAYECVAQVGYVRALKQIAQDPVSVPAQRWATRLAQLPEFDIRALERLHTIVVIPGDEYWPEQVNDLGPATPLALYMRGDVAAVKKPMVTIVGSRAATPDALRLARDLAYDLASDFTIVSGGAFGVDAAVHEGALLAGGHTVLVSAAGVDRAYPRSHDELYRQIRAGGGAIISESPIGAAPHRHRFLSRNRILAALSAATIVVEAPFRSGALSTARHALAMGRPLGACPGTPSMPYAAGCHELIRNGATLVTCADHVRELAAPLGTYEIQADLFTLPDDSWEPRVARVWDALALTRPLKLEKIAQGAGLTAREALTALGTLRAYGAVEEHAGGWQRARVEA